MIKILHLQILPLMSGAQKFSAKLASALGEQNVKNHVVFSKLGSTDDTSSLYDSGFDNFVVHLSKYLRREIGFADFLHLFWLSFIILKIRPDLIVAVSSKNVVFGVLSKLVYRRAKLVRVVQGIPFRLSDKSFVNRMIRFVDLRFTAFCDEVWVVNKSYEDVYRVVNRRTFYIPNSSDFGQAASFKTDIVADTDTDTDTACRMLYVGRLDFQKNVDFLLDVWASLSVNFRGKIHLEIVGDGPDSSRLKTRVNDLEISDSVTFHGWQSDTAPFYERSDIFVMFSRYEGFGYVLLDAAQYRLPCVCCGVEGILDVVKHNVGGYLIPQNDQSRAVAYLSSLIRDPISRSAVGEAHYTHCVEQFHDDVVFALYRDRVENLLGLNLAEISNV